MEGISEEIRQKAPLILAEIKKAKSVLLHCHPSPDPDSVGSALALKFAVESLGVKATVIKGDSEIPKGFLNFPGAANILMKSYWEIDPADYDLFVIVDAGMSGISRKKPVQSLPEGLTVINIDHHATNAGCGKISIVDSSYPAAAELVYDILSVAGLKIGPEMAANLLVGMYTDTGGFKYEGVSKRTFKVAAELISLYPDFPKMIEAMESSLTLGDLAFRAAGLNSVETACAGKIILSAVPNSLLVEKKVPDISVSTGEISTILRLVGGFELAIALIEARPGLVRLSFRTGAGKDHDVSRLAAFFGGGGHKKAAGATFEMSLNEAKEKVVAKAKEMYNL